TKVRITELKADIPPSQSANGTTGGRRRAVTGTADSEELGMLTLYGAPRRPGGPAPRRPGGRRGSPRPVSNSPTSAQEPRERLPSDRTRPFPPRPDGDLCAHDAARPHGGGARVTHPGAAGRPQRLLPPGRGAGRVGRVARDPGPAPAGRLPRRGRGQLDPRLRHRA